MRPGHREVACRWRRTRSTDDDGAGRERNRLAAAGGGPLGAQAARGHGERRRPGRRPRRPPAPCAQNTVRARTGSDASQTAPVPSRQNAFTPNSSPAPAATSPGSRTRADHSRRGQRGHQPRQRCRARSARGAGMSSARCWPGRWPAARGAGCRRRPGVVPVASRSGCPRLPGRRSAPGAEPPAEPVGAQRGQQEGGRGHRPAQVVALRRGLGAEHDGRRRRPVQDGGHVARGHHDHAGRGRATRRPPRSAGARRRAAGPPPRPRPSACPAIVTKAT